MYKLFLFAIAGLLAQLVDGALGMAFGVTATTVLLFSGLTPAHASAAVHFAEMGTTFASGASHWKLRNVHWPTVFFLGVPGAIGAFFGATLLSNLSTDAAKPVITAILALLGFYVMLRSFLLPWNRTQAAENTAKGYGPGGAPTRKSKLSLGVLGLGGGFLDASGGGGWGPVTTSTLMGLGKAEPRKIIGTVSASEFLVSVAASLGFTFGLAGELQEVWRPVVGLLIGGVIAAPLAAWLVTKLKPQILGGFVGGLLMLINIPRLLAASNEVSIAIAVAAALGIVALVLTRRRKLLGERAARTTNPAENLDEAEPGDSEEKVLAPAYSHANHRE